MLSVNLEFFHYIESWSGGTLSQVHAWHESLIYKWDHYIEILTNYGIYLIPVACKDTKINHPIYQFLAG